MKDLTGDRIIENAFILKHMPTKKSVLDIGYCHSDLALKSAEHRNKVIAIDINEDLSSKSTMVEYIKENFLTHKFNQKFDYIILCSTLEHFGISGRYNSYEDTTADYKAMQKAKQLLNQKGTIALTIPVGIWNIVKPFHKIYGVVQLGFLFESFKILEQIFYGKQDGVNFSEITQLQALNTNGNKDYYAIGCFLLEKDNK
jgi:hypothetical protein